MGWVSNLKKLRGRDLRRTRVAFIRQLDRRALEALALEFLAEIKP